MAMSDELCSENYQHRVSVKDRWSYNDNNIDNNKVNDNDHTKFLVIPYLSTLSSPPILQHTRHPNPHHHKTQSQ